MKPTNIEQPGERAPVTDPAEVPAREPDQQRSMESQPAAQESDLRLLDLALRRYDILMQQNRFEHTSFWSRFGFMLVSQMALLGFFFKALSDATSHPELRETLQALALSAPLPIIGLFLIARFMKLHNITRWWIDHWLSEINRHEQAAFGAREIVRGMNEKAKREVGSVRDEATAVSKALGFAWGAGIFAVFVIAGAAWAHSDTRPSALPSVAVGRVSQGEPTQSAVTHSIAINQSTDPASQGIPWPALATLAAATIAGVIAWRQYATARTKLKLDLFDRRFAVFQGAEALVHGVIADPTCPVSLLHAFGAATNQALFLFGADVNDHLKQLLEDAVALRSVNVQLASLNALDDKQRQRAIERDAELLRKLTEAAARNREVFGKYLRLPHPL